MRIESTRFVLILAGCSLAVALMVSDRASAECGDYVTIGGQSDMPDHQPATDPCHGPSCVQPLPVEPSEPCSGPSCQQAPPSRPLAPPPVPSTNPPTDRVCLLSTLHPEDPGSIPLLTIDTGSFPLAVPARIFHPPR